MTKKTFIDLAQRWSESEDTNPGNKDTDFAKNLDDYLKCLGNFTVMPILTICLNESKEPNHNNVLKNKQHPPSNLKDNNNDNQNRNNATGGGGVAVIEKEKEKHSGKRRRISSNKEAHKRTTKMELLRLKSLESTIVKPKCLSGIGQIRDK